MKWREYTDGGKTDGAKEQRGMYHFQFSTIKGYTRKREIKDRGEARTMVAKRGKKNMGKEQTEKDEDAEERGRETEKRKMGKEVREWK